MFSVDRGQKVKSINSSLLVVAIFPCSTLTTFFALKWLWTRAFPFCLPWKVVLEPRISHSRKSFDQLHLLFLMPCLCSWPPWSVSGFSESFLHLPIGRFDLPPLSGKLLLLFVILWMTNRESIGRVRLPIAFPKSCFVRTGYNWSNENRHSRAKI